MKALDIALEESAAAGGRFVYIGECADGSRVVTPDPHTRVSRWLAEVRALHGASGPACPIDARDQTATLIVVYTRGAEVRSVASTNPNVRVIVRGADAMEDSDPPAELPADLVDVW